MTNQQGTPEAMLPIARYKIGYHTDEWGMRSSTPSGIPDHAGAWVRYEDHIAAMVEAQQPAPSAAVAPSDDLRGRLVAISAAIADQDDRAAQAMLREILAAPQPTPTPQADSQPTPVQDYPPLPESIKYGQLDHSSGAYGYRPQDMRAYVDADRAMRAQAAPVAVAGPSPTASFEKALSAYLTGDGFIAADDIPNICNDFAQLLAVMACAVRWAPSSAYWSDQLRMYFGEDARKGIDALEKQLRDALAAPQPLPAAPVRDYPQLPDFDTVEQHIYGACRRYITQDMLEPIHNLIRDAIDADRAARAPADSVTAPAAYSGNIEQELAMLIRRIVSSARRNCEDGSNVLKLANEAWVYLVRKGLNGSPLRDAGIESDPTSAAQAADSVLEDAGGANWQDISTAPKDGTRFVAVGNNYGLYSEMQHTCIAQWFRGCWIEASDWNETSELKYLTHWMPLLPLPGSAARKQGANHD